MRLITFTYLLFISTLVLADTNNNYLPLYGDMDRSSNTELIKQDNAFIAKATQTFGTREHASEGYVERGFDLYSENKFDKSMQRFNQAWLLNNNNPHVYLGFGLLLNQKKQSCEAADMFKLAKEKGLKESGFLADYAYTITICAQSNTPEFKTVLFDESNRLFNLAIKTPNNNLKAYAYHTWAKSYFIQKEFSKSQAMLDQSRDLGGKIDATLEQSIKNELIKTR